MINQIHQAGERAAALTKQLLAFSRKQILTPQVVDLNDVVAKIEKLLKRLIGADVELACFLDPTLGRTKVDPNQIEQVLLNLVVNSRDAMPAGGKLTIETYNEELDEEYASVHHDVVPGRYVAIAVSDTGVGMDAATQARIFEPFFTTKEPGRGTGLGLATSFGIVKQSQGHIWVYSEPGGGAAFKVYLPRVDESPAPAPVAAKSDATPMGNETILLVEDDDAVRQYAARVLERQGYEVLAAGNGDEALVICDEHAGPIHLLATDMVMPKMGGLQLVERLASARPEIKVVFMSGYTDNAVVHHGVLQIDIPFLHKPFTPKLLLGKVREVLDGPPQKRTTH
jgi:CheY-like chemotaxis protein